MMMMIIMMMMIKKKKKKMMKEKKKLCSTVASTPSPMQPTLLSRLPKVSPIPFDALAHEVLMVLRDESLCGHSTYHGGTENSFFRGSNGQSRYVTCKERDCNKVVIKGKRTDAVDLWHYVAMIALTTRRRQSLRSHGLFQRVCRVRGQALEAQERGPPGDGSASTSPTSPSWQLLGSSRAPGSPPAFSGNAASSGGYPQAKIKRQHHQCFWLYGVA